MINILDELKEIYQDNINWLNFAELKNGVLLTISGLFLQFTLDNIQVVWMKYVLIALCSIIIILNCISFIPFLNSNKILTSFAKKYYSLKYNDSKEDKNIVFYVNVFLSSDKEYLSAIKKITKASSFNDFEINYINQIKAICVIASIKYFLFTLAACVFLFTIITFSVMIILA